jgi:hypothetical protein
MAPNGVKNAIFGFFGGICIFNQNLALFFQIWHFQSILLLAFCHQIWLFQGFFSKIRQIPHKMPVCFGDHLE